MWCKRFYLFMIMFCWHLPIYASSLLTSHQTSARRVVLPDKNDSSVGDIAGNLFDFTQNVGQLFKVVAITVGVALVLFGAVQYRKHRHSPVETPISTVIMTVVIGLGLIALSFIPLKS
jgi:hypothetical protein